ncbi:hypothetical protein C0J52_01722 [Blattella germanica]|nr:hypothetical protein C0J52_01722 [Blattella germanica]
MEKKMAVAMTLLMLIMLLGTSSTAETARRPGNCPPVSYVYKSFNKCYSDFDCSGSQKCCPNTSGSKSCADARAVGEWID